MRVPGRPIRGKWSHICRVVWPGQEERQWRAGLCITQHETGGRTNTRTHYTNTLTLSPIRDTVLNYCDTGSVRRRRRVVRQHVVVTLLKMYGRCQMRGDWLCSATSNRFTSELDPHRVGSADGVQQMAGTPWLYIYNRDLPELKLIKETFNIINLFN